MQKPIIRSRALRMAYAIPSVLWPAEQAWIYDAFSSSKRHVEIGSYCGRSLFIAGAGMGEGRILAVDSFVGADIGRDWTKEVCEASIRLLERETSVSVRLLEKTSIEGARELAGSIQRDNSLVFDSLWIDGDHHYAEVKQDIEMWSPLVRPGGLISGHDFWPKDHGVMDAVSETGPYETIPNTRVWLRRA